MKFLNKMFFKKGVGLVEIIVASSIISITVLVLLSVYTMVSNYSLTNIKQLKGAELAEETVEVLKFFRDSSWTKNIAPLTTGVTYHPYWNVTLVPKAWTATTSNILLENEYQVSFVLSNVNRDSNYNVVTSGGTLDAGSKKVNITVTWTDAGVTTTKKMETYLFNIFNN